MVQSETARRGDDWVVVRVNGDLAGQLWTDAIRHTLRDHYVDDGVRCIRLDVRRLRFLDNFGVATLVVLQRESQQKGKRLLVEGSQGQVRDKLRMTGVLKLLEGGG
jgi:anti-anti-sigma factor